MELVQPQPATSLRDWAYAQRDRLLASERFRHWASSFPLTRPLARRRTRALFDLCAGFVYSQILAACVQVRLFDILADGPQTAVALSGRIGLPLAGTERLLAAAVALRLVARRSGGRFGLGPLGGAMVGYAAISEMVKHHAMLYADLRDPLALLRGKRGGRALSGYWPYAETDRPDTLRGEQVAAYTSLMSASQPLVADEILDAYRLDKHRCLLDLGGGDGTFLSRVAIRAPHLKLMLFDLPPVAERARRRFAAAGLGDRATAYGGDFHDSVLPQGADVVSLVRVIHDHDDTAAQAILNRAFKALPVGGTLLLAEPMADTPGAEPIGDAYFGFYLLAMGSGRPRSAAALTKMLQQAGFERVTPKATRTPLLTSLLVATRGPVAGGV